MSKHINYITPQKTVRKAVLAVQGEILSASGFEKAQIAHRIISNPKVKTLKLSLREIAEFFSFTKQALLYLLKKYPPLPPQSESVPLETARTDSGCGGSDGDGEKKGGTGA